MSKEIRNHVTHVESNHVEWLCVVGILLNLHSAENAICLLVRCLIYFSACAVFVQYTRLVQLCPSCVHPSISAV